MLKSFLSATALVIGLSASAAAKEYLASQEDVGAGDCSNAANACDLDQAISLATSPGDIITLLPGTFSGNKTLTADGTSGNPITLRATNYAVICPDAENDPDGCEVNTAGTSNLNLSITLDNADWWVFEGIEIRSIICDNRSTSGVLRYSHLKTGELQRAGNTFRMDPGCDHWLVEHNYWSSLTPWTTGGHDTPPGDYGIAMYWASNNTFRNLYFGGNSNHAISIKRGGTNNAFDRIVCESFADAQCIILGQEVDGTNFASQSPTSCPNAIRNDGTTATITDQTTQNVIITNVFARHGVFEDPDPPSKRTRAALMIDNARNVTVRNLFSAVPSHTSGSRNIWFRNVGAASGQEGGRCGVERGNISIRGAILVATDANNGCIVMSSLGESPATTTLENIVCYNAGASGSAGVRFTNGVLNFDFGSGAWETQLAPDTTVRNSVFSDCKSAFSGAGNAISLSQSFNNVFGCGTLSGTGNQSVDPNFTGPSLTVPVVDLDNRFVDGARLWDWEGTYLPIIKQFVTEQASFMGAGTGNEAPGGGTRNIGANESFHME
jgi:hypothetical protein